MRENKQIARQALEDYEVTKAEEQKRAIEIIEGYISSVPKVAREPFYVTILEEMSELEKGTIMDAFNLTELNPEELNKIIRL